MGVNQLIAKRRVKEITTIYARSLRRNMTDAERKLWQGIRNCQINSYRFRRQHPIGNYIVDFASLEKKLAIELDGGQRQNRIDYDNQRTHFLNEQGWCVIRFWNNDVLSNPTEVLSRIETALTD